MKCMICKGGEAKQTAVQAEIKVGYDHLLVMVEAESCADCGEPYYSANTLRYPERLREEFTQKEISRRVVGKVHEIS